MRSWAILGHAGLLLAIVHRVIATDLMPSAPAVARDAGGGALQPQVDGVFEADCAGGVRFREARGVGPEIVAEVKAQVRHRLLSVLARRGVLERADAAAMGTWDHAGIFGRMHIQGP